MMKKAFLSLLLIHAIDIHAQNTIGIPRIINYSKDAYRGGTQTWDIDQDSKGRLYFANNEGLLTFDGNFWKIHPLPNKSNMRSVAIDEKGLVYVGGQGEIGYFAPDARGNLRFTSLLPLLPEAQRNITDIWDMEVIGESVFFRVAERMILQLNNNSFSVYPAATDWISMKTAGGKLYAQDRSKGLFQFRSQRWMPIAGSDKLLTGKTMAGLFPSATNALQLITGDFQSFLLQQDSLSQDQRFRAPSGTSSVFRAIRMNNGEITVSTLADGCMVVKNTGELIQRIARKEGLQNNNVISVFQDRDRNIWTGLNNGISIIAYHSAVKFITPNKENQVSGTSSRIHRGSLYVGSSDGVYSVGIDNGMDDLSFVKGDFALVKNSSGQTWKVDEVNGEMLIAHTGGLLRLQNGSAEKISRDPGWLFVPMDAITPSRHVLTGTYSGLKMLEYEGGQFKDMGNLQSGTSESLRFLTMDNEGRIWASHPYRGVYLITLSPDRRSFSAELFTEKNGLPSVLDNHVFRIRNKVVFGTSNGVFEFNGAERRFEKSAFLDTIIGDMDIRYLNEDENGNIWFCSGKRLGVADLKKIPGRPQITLFPELKGKILSGFESIYPYNRQNIFIASESGIIHLNYEKYIANESRPKVILSLIKASGRSDSTLYGGYRREAGNEQETKTSLHPAFNAFHFEYSATAYGMEDNIEYAYMLDGYEQKWSPWTDRPEKDYTNLSSGNYTFRVKARDNLGHESETATYAFTILPPWYMSYWAWMAYLAIAALGIRMLLSFQRQKLLKQKLKYEEKQRQINVLHQLQLEKNEKEIIQLKNEKLENEIVLKTRELADTSMHLVERSDALLKVKESLEQLYKKTNGNHDIKKALHMLNDIERNNEGWERFASHFDEINNNLLKNLKTRHPKLSNTDLKLCAYLELNLSSKEIAQLMNISVRGVEIGRYRLRKKLGIHTEQSVQDFLEDYRQS